MSKKLIPTNDYVFKRIFGRAGNEDITREFIKAATGYEFKNIKLDDTPILEKDLVDNKIGVLDVRVVANEINNIDIEMQVVKSAYMAERILWYWSKMYYSSVKEGRGYDTAKKAICILIADFELENLKEIPKYKTRWRIREEEYKNKVLTEKLDIVIIELGKLDSKKDEEKEELIKWCKFIKDPEKAEESIMSNEYIKKAKEKLDEINMSEEEIRRAEMRERALKDEMAIRDGGYIDGKEDGIKEGKKERNIEIVREMLNNNMSVETIIKITHLSREDIENIKRNNY